MKVSYCITIKNRIQYLAQVLPYNLGITHTADCEFVIVDYNSEDMCFELVTEVFENQIRSGRIKYFRTKEPKHFRMSHAKNIAHMNATGDILCNLDADNLLLKGFHEFLLTNLSGGGNFVFSSDTPKKKGLTGRVAMLKSDFLKVNGYDERVTFGFDDYDMRDRLLRLGLKKIVPPHNILECLEHSDEMRLANVEDKKTYNAKEFWDENNRNNVVRANPEGCGKISDLEQIFL